MPGYTSAAELAAAKRMHRCEIGSSSPQARPSPTSTQPSQISHVTPRRSHADFESEKRRHLTDITCSPRREVDLTPRESAVYGHTHGDMQGPPYHKSCREFSHEKTEHLTPMLPSRGPQRGGHGGCMHTSPEKCTSNEAFSAVKRKHNHELDSCSPRRAAAEAAAAAAAEAAAAGGEGGAAGESGAISPSHCTSQERFRANKMMHAHGMDECHHKHEAVYSGGALETPTCSSSELFRKEKALHRHGIDECKPKAAEPEPEPEYHGRCVSVDRFTKEKRAHRHAIDQCCPKEVAAPVPEEEGPHGSQIKLQKLKRNHDHAIEASPQREGPPPASEDPEKSKRSCTALTASKKKHAKDMSLSGRGSQKPSHCVSNEEYAIDKKKHRHMVDSCRECSPQGTKSMYTRAEETSDGQCKSLNRMNAAKRRHDHTMDAHKSSPGASPEGHHGDGRCPSPKCKSNSEFAANKRHHRHEMDECSPPREDRAAGAPDHTVCTSNQSFSRDKRSHKHPLDACRTPRRELFDTHEPPVITSSKMPEPEATPATPATPASAAPAAEEY